MNWGEDAMKKKMAKTSLYMMMVAFIVGMILIFSSAAIGQGMGRSAMQANGGSIDTRVYERIIDTNTLNYRTAGAIISLIGGFGVLLSGYAVYKEL